MPLVPTKRGGGEVTDAVYGYLAGFTSGVVIVLLALFILRGRMR
jgi:hypothetical protein